MIFTINSPKYGLKEVQIDDEDWPLVSRYKWHVQFDPTFHQFYIVTCSLNGKTIKAIKLHRLVMNQEDPKMKVDHIDHDTLNNRKENLRACTGQNNGWNSKKTKRTTASKYKGVTKIQRGTGFVSRIGLDNKRLYLGYFKTEEEAALAYNEAALKYHKEFACLNETKE